MRYLQTLLACYLAFTLLFTGCKKDKVRYQDMIVGEWHGTSGEALKNASADIWISFGSDGDLTLYQKLSDDLMYTLYRGDYSVSGSTLSGHYADGTPWGSDYTISFEGQDKMTLEGKDGETVYTRALIGQNVSGNVRTSTKVTEDLFINDKPL